MDGNRYKAIPFATPGLTTYEWSTHPILLVRRELGAVRVS